jgi:hypothetical protein
VSEPFREDGIMTELIFAGLFGLMCLGAGVLIGRQNERRRRTESTPLAGVVAAAMRDHTDRAGVELGELRRCKFTGNKRRCKNQTAATSGFCTFHWRSGGDGGEA